MSIIERILQFIDYKGITKYEFHKTNGFSNGFLDKDRAIGSDKCEKILKNYPELNPEWLVTGKGEMLKNQNITINSGDNSGAIVGNNHGKISIKKEKKLTPEELLFQREISYLNEKIEMKNREIKILEREITSFKGILNEVNNIKMETEKSRSLITDLYERKINDLKHTIAVLEAQMGLKLSN